MEPGLFSDLFYILIGVPFTFLSWLGFSFWYTQLQKRKTVLINQNLKKVGRRWSFERDSIVEYEHRDRINSFQQYMILGFASSFFSWFGFIFSWIAWGSLYFVKSRREKFILNSELNKSDFLEVSQINEICEIFFTIR